jgi:alpha-glucosidase
MKTWIDFDAAMNVQYHVADAGWENRGVNWPEITAYGRTKGVGVIGWGKVATKSTLNTPERAEAWMANTAKQGLSGAKIDFFDQADGTGAATADLEDTQKRLWVRDFLSEIAIKHKLVMEFHGCAPPSGERRRWQHVLAAEGIYGMERRTQIASHDLTIPYVRNMMGAVSFTPIHLSRGAGSHAWQLAQTVIYETGVQIFSDIHSKILAWKGAEFLKVLENAWDETRFLEGYPGQHTIMARRKGSHWFVGGMSTTAGARTVKLDFLQDGVTYEAHIYRDGPSKTEIAIEKKDVNSRESLSIATLGNGGFAVYFKHPNPSAILDARMPRVRGAEFTFGALGGSFGVPARKGVAVYDLQGRLLYSRGPADQARANAAGMRILKVDAP